MDVDAKELKSRKKLVLWILGIASFVILAVIVGLISIQANLNCDDYDTAGVQPSAYNYPDECKQ